MTQHSSFAAGAKFSEAQLESSEPEGSNDEC